jgi:hypothetical protein
VPKVFEPEDALAEAGLARTSVRGMRVSLSSLLSEAQARGLVAQNVVRARGERKKGGNGRAKLKIGVDIPSLDEIKRLIPHLTGPRPPVAHDRDLHRPARVRAARASLVRRRPQEGRDPCPAACRRLER